VVSEYHRPSMTRPARSFPLFVLMAALVGLLLVLAPNLQRIELRPAKLSADPAASVETYTPSLGNQPTGAGAVAILLRILFTAAVVCLALIVIGAIFRKELRWYLLSLVVVTLLFLGLFALLKRGTDRVEPTVSFDETPAIVQIDDRPAAPSDEEAPPPTWSYTAAAITISIGIALLLAAVLTRFASRWGRRVEGQDRTELEELIETVGAAADEIQLGGDPRSAVLRCYREMLRIFAQRKTLDHAHLTARELAAALHRAGFTAQHVDQLTEIFELVRYGNRGGQPLAERAIGCLVAIRKAYASS